MSAKKKETRVSSRGKIVIHPVTLTSLAGLRKNGWNPNRLTPFEKEGVRFALRKDGWLASHALTVWGKDDKGKEQNTIIDGEHRWALGLDMGMELAPACFVDGLSEAKAKELTIKLDAKRGKFDEEKLRKVLRIIEPELDLETRSLDLGIGEDKLAEYLTTEETEVHVTGDLPSGQQSNVKGVQLYFNPEQRAEFDKLAKEFAVRAKTENVSDTVYEAMRAIK